MPRPNILLITSDQQHYSALGAVNPHIQTPALDRLASQGVRFDRAYCVNPVCSPSRSTMITGLYPAWHGCWTIGVKLPEDVPTVGDVLGEQGYATCLVGKAHFQPLASAVGSESIECQPAMRDLGFWRSFHGPWYGFQRVETGRMRANESRAGQHYALWLEEQGLANWRDYFVVWPEPKAGKYSGPYYTRDALTWDLPERFHHSHWVGERAVANIERAVAQGQPFFQWASFFDPHPGYILPEPWASLYDPADMPIGRYQPGELDDMPPQRGRAQQASPDFRDYQEPGGQGLHGFHSRLHTEDELRRSMACYYGMMSLIDVEVGRILDALERFGVAEDTLVLFSTDHGHFLGQHGLIAKGAFHYEDLLRIPMIARFPGRISAGQVNTTLQSQIDWVPTFLEAAGLAAPGSLQGHSQLGVWGRRCGGRPRPCAGGESPQPDHRAPADAGHRTLQDHGIPAGGLWRAVRPAGRPRRAALHRFVQAEMEREPTRMPRVTHA